MCVCVWVCLYYIYHILNCEFGALRFELSVELQFQCKTLFDIVILL